MSSTTPAQHSPTLREVVAVHEAAVALGRPSKIYRVGAVLGPDRWFDFAEDMTRRKDRETLAGECFDLAVLAELYGTAGRVAEIFEARQP